MEVKQEVEKTILIADDNTALTAELTEFFSKSAEYKVVGVAADGNEALALLDKASPDFLLLDIVMPELDGFGVLSAIKCMSVKPTIIMISQLATEGIISKAVRNGADFFMAKPLNFDKLKCCLDEYGRPEQQVTKAVFPMFSREMVRAGSHNLDEKISNIFISVGIPAHIKGYQFLREAIKLAIQTPEIINSITKKLYPSIALKFETSPSKVERAIRHAIEVAWNRGRIDNINMIFGLKVYNAGEKPTNGEFIALIADKICLEGMSA